MNPKKKINFESTNFNFNYKQFPTKLPQKHLTRINKLLNKFQLILLKRPKENLFFQNKNR
jgi:hypothetical protein